MNPKENNFVPQNPEDSKIGFITFSETLGNKKAGEFDILLKLVYWPFGQNKMHHTLNACPHYPERIQMYVLIKIKSS